MAGYVAMARVERGRVRALAWDAPAPADRVLPREPRDAGAGGDARQRPRRSSRDDGRDRSASSGIASATSSRWSPSISPTPRAGARTRAAHRTGPGPWRRRRLPAAGRARRARAPRRGRPTPVRSRSPTARGRPRRTAARCPERHRRAAGRRARAAAHTPAGHASERRRSPARTGRRGPAAAPRSRAGRAPSGRKVDPSDERPSAVTRLNPTEPSGSCERARRRRVLDLGLLEDVARRGIAQLQLDDHAPERVDRAPGATRVDERRRPRSGGDDDRARGSHDAIHDDAGRGPAVAGHRRVHALDQRRAPGTGERREGVRRGRRGDREADRHAHGGQARRQGRFEGRERVAVDELGRDVRVRRREPASGRPDDVCVPADREDPGRLRARGGTPAPGASPPAARRPARPGARDTARATRGTARRGSDRSGATRRPSCAPTRRPRSPSARTASRSRRGRRARPRAPSRRCRRRGSRRPARASDVSRR